MCWAKSTGRRLSGPSTARGPASRKSWPSANWPFRDCATVGISAGAGGITSERVTPVSDNGHRRIELMSPAGSLEGAALAFDAGADVVYAGVKNLSMRPKRVEFDQNLGELIDYAHGRGKKVYVTTNVCPKPSDIPLFERRMAEVSALGADAVIVSDPWVMEHVRDNYPNLPIHASIMTSVVNAEAAKFYQERGATMVVISRSLGDLDEIRRIKEDVKVDLEVFVHGGICYMYDGDCYMSSYWRQRRDYDPDLDA